MSTVFPFGAARCIDCKAPVAIVRRAVEVRCSPLDADSQGLPQVCILHDWKSPSRCDCHTHAVPDAVVVVVDAEGERHQCPVVD